LDNLLRNGYFPRELPPPFNTNGFADYFKTNTAKAPYKINQSKGPNYTSEATTYQSVRAGTLRRPLKIVNPVNFFQIAQLMTTSWPSLERHYAKSSQAFSRPIPSKNTVGARAYEWSRGFDQIAEEKAKLRVGMRYGLKTDIKSFYPSLYTHSLPWAMQGKKKSQDNTAYGDSLGNQIDRTIQQSQNKQTKGIPIGPDTSLLAAEILLTTIDCSLVKNLGTRYFRYMDDYEFSFPSFQAAEEGLATFQSQLSDYELIPNESKTKIFEIPDVLDPAWIKSLRTTSLLPNISAKRQRTELLDLFNTTLSLWKEYPDQAVVKYAVIKTASTAVDGSNWQLYQHLLFQWAQAENEVLPVVLDLLLLYTQNGYELDKSGIGDLLEILMAIHAPRGHTSEIAWALWGAILFDIKLSEAATATLCRIDDPVIALLALDAHSKKLTHSSFSKAKWAEHMKPENLQDKNWLLAYEARIQKWLPPVGTNEYVKTANGLGTLGDAKVSFYDCTKKYSYQPKPRNFWQLKFILASNSYPS
jgi:Reverse transcriptase (RNA-dependent DNA polymerase)